MSKEVRPHRGDPSASPSAAAPASPIPHFSTLSAPRVPLATAFARAAAPEHPINGFSPTSSSRGVVLRVFVSSPRSSLSAATSE